MGLWKDSEIEAILIQLQERELPFPYCEFVVENGRLCQLGKGANANVYRAVDRNDEKERYAIKVIGFGDRCVRSGDFYSSALFQMEAGERQKHVVQVYSIEELKILLDGDHNVTKAEIIPITMEDEESEPEEGALCLQFIVMEEIAPVISRVKMGNPVLFPKMLAHFEEKEILHLACDIATALEAAHKEQLLHRDVKLENIFYTPRGEHYKLGDFGIARIMANGIANTVAFTKGYGAPEVVGMMGDAYDCTADIYSLGMVLYVLLNGLCFPGSQNYHPNAAQYMGGFRPEHPAGGSDDFCEVVLKMIQSDPDERYQSMEEVLNVLEGLRYGKRVQFQREHKWASLTLGILFAVGGFLLKAGGLAASWFGWKSVLPDGFGWMSGLLSSLSAVLLCYHVLLGRRGAPVAKALLEKNSYWMLIAALYGILGILFRAVLPAGLCGMAFCAFWVCRENLLLWIDRHKESPDV